MDANEAGVEEEPPASGEQAAAAVPADADAAPEQQAASDAPPAVEGLDDALVGWFRAKLALLLPAGELWREAEHLPALEEFMLTPSPRLFAFIDGAGAGSLRLQKAPPAAQKALVYFLRDPSKAVTAANADALVRYGSIRGNVQEFLLGVLSGVFQPAIQGNKSWPETLRKDLSGQLHKLMASLTERVHGAQGHTVLYVPPLDAAGDPAAAAGDKELVRQLESTLIHWTRQIKNVVNSQERTEGDAGPLAEIAYWRDRAVDLTGLRAQLDTAGVAGVVAVLAAAKSTYVAPFSALSEAIATEAMVAESNLQFLTLLEEPCTALTAAGPKDIPPILPKLLNNIRIIWNISRFYNTPERLIALLRRVSTEVIARCRATVVLSDLFDGHVARATDNLRDAIAAGEAWRSSYERTAAAVARTSPRPWSFDPAAIFAQSDAFVQRSRDLLEVAEALLQFAPTAPLPVFGGTRGPATTKAFQDVQAQFRGHVAALERLGYDVLDPKNTQWHDDYASFRAGVKELENTVTRAMAGALEGAGALTARVDLLVAFNSLAKREAVKRAVEKATADCVAAHVAELTAVRKMFDSQRTAPPLHPSFPHFAGAALWAAGLERRLEAPIRYLLAHAAALPHAPELADLGAAFEQTQQSLGTFARSRHGEWFTSITMDVRQRLETKLLAVAEGSDGLLRVNFDKTILGLMEEARLWGRLRFDVPVAIQEISARREQFRLQREAVLALAREYNAVITAIEPGDRKLFADRTRTLDKRIAPGLNKITWESNKRDIDFFVREARKACGEAAEQVAAWKAVNARIGQLCAAVADTLLVQFAKKHVYGLAEFEAAQRAHREAARERFATAAAEIGEQLARAQEIFDGDGEEVRQEWRRYTQRVDKRAEDALRTCIKRSLQELSRALNGDARTEVVPVFSATMVLDVRSTHCELSPTMQSLLNMVHEAARDCLTVCQAVPRLGARADGDPEPPSFFSIISADEETTLKLIVAITTGASSIVEKVSAYQGYWERKYRPLWEQDKESYMRRYEKARKPLSAFEADISRYKQMAEDVQQEEATHAMKFMRIDCVPLKQVLLGHCEQWVSRFTGLLSSSAHAELEDLYGSMATSSAKLARAPGSLDALADAVSLLQSIRDGRDAFEGRFAPLGERYALLEKFQVPPQDGDLDRLAALPTHWAAFQESLERAAQAQEGYKEGFRDKLVKLVEGLSRDVFDHRAAFEAAAPMNVEAAARPEAVAAARHFLDTTKAAIAAFRKRESELRAGLRVFRLPAPPLRELASTEKDMELLEALWEIVGEWAAAYDGWKGGRFRDLNVEEMEGTAVNFNKRIQKLPREAKAWGSWASLRDTVESFKKTMPLITDLRNPVLRPRHWASLMDAVGERFDPTSDAFTLGAATDLRLDLHADLIGELSTNATKEFAIESVLEKITGTWEVLTLDMAPFKEGRDVFKLRSTEDVFAALEDNVVTLSTMKSSKFYMVFEKPINFWEQTLSLVSEMIESIQKVQQAWMYLENIFLGSEDIRKQLPAESAMFDAVNANFTEAMREMQEVGNVVQATGLPGMLGRFTDMDTKLERIQKSLDNYLEKKRQQFPRFYFISADDLLEILGQAKDPQNVQSHLKGMFEGIKRLELQAPGTDGRKGWEATAMIAPDTEYVVFQPFVKTDGRPEDWLNKVEAAMYLATKKQLHKTLEESRSMKKEKWVKDFPGQCIISAGQIVWTMECEKALADADAARGALRLLKKKWVSYLNKLTALTRSKLSKVDRSKTVALITIEVHARDVIEKLGKAGCASPNDFEWVSQLRFYWDRDANDCVVKQVISVFNYGYEYQGNNGRLVVTPLTDRCYMTLGTALFTRRGGNPLGPAGTGKTETVKDFGKALARYVIVFNCSDGVDYKMTGKMFSGLAQTGAWACLDEFNRIEVEVLSVVATQISNMMAAIKAKLKRFVFEGQEIRLIPSCGIFVTMNPGYAGRSELPDNLKAIVRPVSMMVPDFTLIAEIMMFSEGFQSAKVLAKKMVAIMELSQQQLSKQDHYDYGLRSFVIPISRAAGAMKRADPDAPEEIIMYRTMRDLIMPKLVYLDLPLFQALLTDLFPGVELPAEGESALRRELCKQLTAEGLQVVPDYVTKIIQIFDCKVARHGNMIVGRTGSGKSEAWKCLSRAMAQLRKEGVEGEFERVTVHTINPLALSNDEIYGCFDPGTHEWTDGVLARIMRTVCKDEGLDQKWILFDGPVDTLWIESMNTLLDDNKLLTLLSGERISMPAQVSILFEVEDLKQASPATVSRAGMIYLNVEDLGWAPYVKSWLQRKEARKEGPLAELLARLVERWLGAALEFRRRSCRELVPTDTLSAVRQLTYLFDALATAENGYTGAEGEGAALVELWFLFALIWSVGASVDDGGRRKFDAFVREQEPNFPSTETVYEYWVDPKRRAWAPWEEKLSANYRPPPELPFFKIMIPTIDTVRTKFVVGALVGALRHCLIVGGVGVGKSMIAQTVLGGLPDGRASMVINFSAQTSSNSLQDTIEGKLEKRTKGVFAPAGGKKLVCFIDDFNMPKKSVFGFMPPLELLKLWVDNGFWYDRAKQEVKKVQDMQLLAAMAPPGGGRNAFSERILACYCLINVTSPSDAQLSRIFSSMLHGRLAGFDDEIKPLAEPIAAATVDVFNQIAEKLLPTPSKSHYLFNTRDLAKVIQGVMQATRQYYDNKESMLQLWVHECTRVFGDRMWDAADRTWLRTTLDGKLGAVFGSSFSALFPSGELAPFATFMRAVEAPPYEAVTDMAALKTFLTEKLEEYALEPGKSAMDLVLFRDALHHVCRIHRVLVQPRGNALLVGVGGSGRKSLARLAAFVTDLKCFSIEITKNYRGTEFHEDLKNLYRQAGVGNKPTVFLFDETQIVVETFLEDINNILTSGEVPNLFSKDELGALCEEVRAPAKAAGAGETGDELYAFFLSRVVANLHVVLCMSPIGDAFRERCRMFPGLVNCCTIDWFTEWPADALYEVALKQLESEDLGAGGAETRDAVCRAFVTCHQSTTDMSGTMQRQLKRRNYVTPTNYLEFVTGYRTMLREKRRELGDKAGKLRGGLEKLAETGEQVGAMQEVCKEKKVVVAQAKKDCEELLVKIIQDKRVADDQKRTVTADKVKIDKEAGEAQAVADECQRGLDKAMPALNSATEALNVLTKKDMTEIKSFSKPPPAVELTLSAVMTVLKRPATWEEAKRALNDATFMDQLKNFDKDEKLDDTLLRKVEKFTGNPDFAVEVVGKVSLAAKGLCLWVHAMYVYGNVAKDVAPKRAKLKAAQDSLSKKQKLLKAAEESLAEVLAKVQALEDTYNSSSARKAALEAELEDLETKLMRAEKLVSGLAGERSRWEASIASYETLLQALPGDCVVGAAFASYAGPFPSEFRDELVKATWLPQVKSLGIPSSDAFDFATFLADPSDVRDWQIAGLPADAFSTENGVLVARGRRWPLMVDPQGQANKWVRNMEKARQCRIVTLAMSDMVRQIETALQFGQPVVLQDIGEEIDPVLEPLLAKAFIKRGNAVLIKLGDKEIDYSPEFKLYITTKLNNPHYTPEVSTKVCIINFAVKEQGLEAQLLNTVVQRERPDLDRQKNELVVKVAAGKRTQAELEDTILHLLATATGSLLDNTTLIATLDQSKTTWEEVNESLKVAEGTARKIEAASAAYRPCSVRAALLYFVLNDLSKIDPMYQFSLDAYNDLFLLSIAKSPRSDVLAERIKALNEYHTYAVYKYTSRGLFEAHKLLLSLQICARVLASGKQLPADEWSFFLRGGVVLDRGALPPNPAADWLSAEAWDNVCCADEQLPALKGLAASFGESKGWEKWYRSAEPEVTDLPGEWKTRCSELQRMIVVRSLRLDRVMTAATAFVANALGRRFVEPPVLDLGETYADSTPLGPLIFVLSPGVDPTSSLQQLATAKGLGDRFFTVALGQGQAPIATRLINEGVRDGNWVFLANCHLMTSWLPELQKIIEGLEERKPHEHFRLWLSSNPTDRFPLAILQRGIKMTTEPPKGLRANLARLYGTVTEESFAECQTAAKYSRLLFALTYFHSVLLERRKFRTLGLNIPYDFNDTDYKVSDDLLKTYLDEYVDTPWDALKYLIAEANYGGRVTDEIDRRVLASYLNQFYCEETLATPNYPLSPLPQYYVPEHGSLQSFRDYIATLPGVDRAEAFGQHPNADISYMMADSRVTLEACESLQPRGAGGAAGASADELVLGILGDLLAQVPKPFDLERIMKSKADDPSALHTVLFQEVERYNALIDRVRSSCAALEKGIKGLVVMSADMDVMFDALAGGKVPPAWQKTYPSLKPLGSWTRDLLLRLTELQAWIDNGYPRVYWLAGFTYPTGFLTAVLQTTARRNGIPIDTLGWEFAVVNTDEADIAAGPKEGVYVKGMFLEGAGWDHAAGCLAEPEPMELIVSMPIIHFKPTESKRKASRSVYSCPLYMYPVRTGTRERPSFMVFVDLKAGAADADHYVKRGTALLLALST